MLSCGCKSWKSVAQSREGEVVIANWKSPCGLTWFLGSLDEYWTRVSRWCTRALLLERDMTWNVKIWWCLKKLIQFIYCIFCTIFTIFGNNYLIISGIKTHETFVRLQMQLIEKLRRCEVLSNKNMILVPNASFTRSFYPYGT